MHLSDSPIVVVLVGPTAVGKSSLAQWLAPRIEAEIISADSRQVYRFMNIGTAKPSVAEQAAVRHHMIDLVAPDDTYSAQRYASDAGSILEKMGRGRQVALIVGGTGFYVRALLDGLQLAPVHPDPELRSRLYLEARQFGGAVLHARLSSLDPASALRIHPNNLARIVRALEVVEHLGSPVPQTPARSRSSALYLGLWLDRSVLRRRIEDRVIKQVQKGLVEETKTLLDMGFSSDLPSMQGFGYREMVEHLSGKFTLDEAIRRYQMATHRYMRRQITWFRPDTRIHWIHADEGARGESLRLARTWIDTENRAAGVRPSDR